MLDVTFAFNHFERCFIRRMSRCRHGYFHVVDNDFTEWKMYAGGSTDPIDALDQRMTTLKRYIPFGLWVFGV